MIARLESRQYLREDEVSLEELITEIKGELSPIAADAGVRITSDCPGTFIFRKANRSLLFSMFYNVVNNAIKHTPPEGSIHVRGEKTGEKYIVTITDTGRGMTEKQLEIIFSRFRTKLDPDSDSTGIGLAITKSIADFHGIGIKVISQPGKGTEFSFIFP
jgi:signal transduction histidine kinase